MTCHSATESTAVSPNYVARITARTAFALLVWCSSHQIFFVANVTLFRLMPRSATTCRKVIGDHWKTYKFGMTVNIWGERKWEQSEMIEGISCQIVSLRKYNNLAVIAIYLIFYIIGNSKEIQARTQGGFRWVHLNPPLKLMIFIVCMLLKCLYIHIFLYKCIQKHNTSTLSTPDPL